ncbi:MAG TPA: COR domain-containing protein [Thermoleophilaceae bacterium]
MEEARTTGVFRIHEESLGRWPEELRHISGLRELVMTDCRLSAIPRWIADLTDLEFLDLANNPIIRLPTSIGTLQSLRSLGLASVPIRELPASLSGLESLEKLVLSGTRLKQLPSWIGHLSALQMLDAGRLELSTLPNSVRQLQKLTHFYLWNHGFETPPPELHNLTSLEVLDLSHSGSMSLEPHRQQASMADAPSRLVGASASGSGPLRALPEWLANDLPALQWLYLGGQRLERLPPRLPPALRGLYAASNFIERVDPTLFDLSALAELDLRANAITDLDPPVGAISRLRYIALADNPLPIPPEVLSGSEPGRIIPYLSQVQGPAKPLDQAKVIVVGEGSVGKTSLVRRLVANTYSPLEQKTEGIAVTRWGVDAGGAPITLDIWDFGGQEIMHATHQFFLTKRSLYMLVIDARQGDEQNRLEYWLKLIQSFSAGSPVILVGNKTEQSPLDIDTRGLMAKYPNVRSILAVSCSTGEGVGSVREVLTDAIAEMPHVRDLLPVAFFDIKERLERLDENYLSFGAYQELCRRHGLTNLEQQELLVGFLHDLGTVLCFREDPRLSDTNILNPDWVTGGVYRLLNSHLAAQRKGLLTWDDVDSILDTIDYPRERRSFIVDMMKRFELCYEADDTFLVPDLLTKEEPDTGSWADALHFEIKYDVLPSSLISRLIVRMHASISHATVWRTGLVVSLDENRGLVKGDREDAVIRIWVTGNPSGRRGLLTAVRRELRAIEGTIPGLIGEERVPVPRHPGVWVPYSHLLDLESAGRDTVVPQGLTMDFSVQELLAGIEAPSERADPAMRSLPESDPASIIRKGDGAWVPSDAIRLGMLLIVVMVVAAAVFVGAERIVGTNAAAGIAAVALAAVALVAVVVLRSSGQLSEAGFLDAVRQTLRRE